MRLSFLILAVLITLMAAQASWAMDLTFELKALCPTTMNEVSYYIGQTGFVGGFSLTLSGQDIVHAQTIELTSSCP